MVDFSKRITKISKEKKINPNEIYDTLDRASDKGPLRPAQFSVLENWFINFKDKKDVILKLHTGQGKTLIGLLILQSNLNQDNGPCLYLCPTHNLVIQTCEQAKQFGIKYCIIGNDKSIPNEYHESQSILITTIQKLFNGLTKFGLNNKSEKAGCIVLDDSHACIDAIRNAFTIIIKNEEPVYYEIFSTLETELEKQGIGTLLDIKNKNVDTFLQVPYWVWNDKHYEIASILSKYSSNPNIVFAWQLIKDIINDCQCFISGSHIEISPYLNPIEQFGTFSKAKHRILMSATTNDDSFFIKGLGIETDSILNPLTYPNEKWSGEKMILIPSLIDESISKYDIIEHFSKIERGRKFGVVALVSSFTQSEFWEKKGAKVSDTKTIDDNISILKAGDYDYCQVFVNRYDGIDLPDDSCRILIIDSNPYGQNLSDRYQENCRSDSDIVLIKIAQKIEQGLGRSVRGEKDYCVIILTGPELVNTIRSKKTRKYFSQQTQTQIEIGLEIAEIAKEDLKPNAPKFDVVTGLIKQSLKREENWKLFYTERMNNLSGISYDKGILQILQLEKEAELKYIEGNYEKAASIIQTIIDKYVTEKSEKGWYMQELARYLYLKSKSESNAKQIVAHKLNRLLLKPKEGMQIEKINFLSQNRIENIKKWIQQFENYEKLSIHLEEILSNLQFGVKAEKFEIAIDELAKILGFKGQRPDKEWKEGPDNLWCLRENDFILFECKNEVKEDRKEVNKDENGQMNNSCAWFENNYNITDYKAILIISTKYVTKAGGFNREVEIMKKNNLNKLAANVRHFYKEFVKIDFRDLSEEQINSFLKLHKLELSDIKTLYTDKFIQN
jgi:replicative superfamily II helicase